ncbi:hypothetical protein ANANG_G00319760 [Anguilla anguilla]|uniref:Uncharacterized protein n=1 Tax=Anguilla anguilla TaxID=7936 RepID=A0A9D3RHL0_ANGAN|nr:hypothetical protein ANANG_G00319760 [Anguilla anguilla]
MLLYIIVCQYGCSEWVEETATGSNITLKLSTDLEVLSHRSTNTFICRFLSPSLNPTSQLNAWGVLSV